METAKGVSPALIAAPPMAKTPALPSSAMTTRTPSSAVKPLGFTQLPGAGVLIAASPDGTFYVLSTTSASGGADKFIFHYVGNGNYVQIPGAAVRIAVAPDSTLWAVNSAGGIYHYTGSWSALAGGASDISIGPDGSVYVIGSQGGNSYGRAIYHYFNGSWTQIPGSAVRVAASWDTGTYPALSITPGGFYALDAFGTIYYYNPSSGFVQIPGGAVEVSATTIGGVFVIGSPLNPNGSPIYYNNLATGQFTQQAGAGLDISTNTTNVYVIGPGNAIYVAPVNVVGNLPPNYVAPNRSDGVTQIPTTAANQFASSMLGASSDGTLIIQSTDTPGRPGGSTFSLTEYTINASQSSAGVTASSQSRAAQAVARESASATIPYRQRLDARTGTTLPFHGRSPLAVAHGGRVAQSVRRVSDFATGTTRVFHVQQGTITGTGGSCNPPQIKIGNNCYLDVNTHLQYVSTHAYVWVDDLIDSSYGLTSADWSATGSTFDADFARETQAFAPAFLSQNPTPTYQQCDANGNQLPQTMPPYQNPPDLSGNDQHISILVTKALENTGEGGYFDFLNLLNDQELNCAFGTSQHVPSNNLPMFVIGADKYPTNGGGLIADEGYWRTQDMPRSLPHEFQHYLHSLNKVIAVDFSGRNGEFDDSFVDEGDSMLAEDLVLGGAVNPPQSPDSQLLAFSYLYTPGNFSLTAFAGYDVDPLSTSQTPTYGFFRSTAGNYGAAYLFTRYLYDRFGQDAALHREYADGTAAPANGSANVSPIQSAANGESFAAVYGEFAAALAARGVASTDPRFRFGSNVLLRGSTTAAVPGGQTDNVVFNGPRSPQDLTSTTPQNLPRIKLTPGASVTAKLITGATQFFNVAPAGGSTVAGSVTGAPAGKTNGALVQGAYDDNGSCFGPPANCHP